MLLGWFFLWEDLGEKKIGAEYSPSKVNRCVIKKKGQNIECRISISNGLSYY